MNLAFSLIYRWRLNFDSNMDVKYNIIIAARWDLHSTNRCSFNCGCSATCLYHCKFPMWPFRCSVCMRSLDIKCSNVPWFTLRTNLTLTFCACNTPLKITLIFQKTLSFVGYLMIEKLRAGQQTMIMKQTVPVFKAAVIDFFGHLGAVEQAGNTTLKLWTWSPSKCKSSIHSPCSSVLMSNSWEKALAL